MRIVLFVIAFLTVSILGAQNFYEKIKAIPQCKYHMENIKALTDGQTKYSRAILSPSAKMILLIGPDKTQIVDVGTQQKIVETEYYFYQQWMSDSLILVRDVNRLKLIPVFPKIMKMALPIPQLSFENRHTLKATKDKKEWIVADIKGNSNLFCHSYLFSNDFQKILIYTNASDYIYYVNGKGLINEFKSMFCCDWSDDGNSLISFLDLDFGNDYIVESDLYINSAETCDVCKLTDTKDILEVYPSWSRDKISYIDDKTGIVYIADLKKNK